MKNTSRPELIKLRQNNLSSTKIPLLTDYSSITINPQLLTTYQYLTTFIHDRRLEIVIKPIPASLWDENEELVCNLFPLFFKDKDLIKIPTKVESVLRSRYIPAALFDEIHPDREVAIELCLMFLSKLSSTYFIMNESDDARKKEGWRSLHSRILIQEFPYQLNQYKKIVNVLTHQTTKGAIIECDNKHQEGVKCFHYRLGEHYRQKGIVSFTIKTKYVKTVLNKNYFRAIAKSMDNTICKNLVRIYGEIELPSHDEIWTEFKRLTTEAKKQNKPGYFTKKGKLLTALNKHSRDYFKDAAQRSFVDDCLEIFDYLTCNGLMIPQVSSERNGGRVVDSFTLMPSWIRNLCKLDGVKICECDFSALHPNIAANLYGGTSEFITHSGVAMESGLELKDIKIEHLSFFNKTWTQMMRSPLYEYYWLKEPVMMDAIYHDKTYNKLAEKDGHKISSMKMFSKEVSIMTAVIERLNSEGVYVGYIYDALFCTPAQKARVIEIMNEESLAQGVKTTAK